MRWFHAVEGEDGGRGAPHKKKADKKVEDKDAEVSVRVLILNG